MRSLLGNSDLTIDIAEEVVPVRLRRNARAKKMILRVDGVNGDIKLTAPKHVSLSALRKFLNEHKNWIEVERAKVQAHAALGSGDVLPYQGERFTLEFLDASPRKVQLFDGKILVGGPADQAPARLERWLRAEAKKTLTDDAADFAEQLGVAIARISIGDMKSRWGSCSSSGTLRFNWRLLLAPVDVRRYVAAHEVAHLLEMNHSPRFWGHVEGMMADYTRHRAWLRKNGSDLMRLRFSHASD